MPEPFGIDFVQALYEHRHAVATALSQFFTFVGDIEGYVLVVCLVYVAYDKKLAFRLAVLVLATMSLNHLLKILIANPRPFVAEGTWAEKWAVSAAKAQELATEYSTPSGHAMAGSAFYAYLCASVTQPYVKVIAVAAILLTGLSRPYLGVHYLEDVLLGWGVGLPLAFLALKLGPSLRQAWDKYSLPQQLLGVVGVSVVLWLVTRAQDEANLHGQPLAFLSYTGFLAGIVLAYPLEAKWIGFEPGRSSVAQKALMFVMSVAHVIGTLVVLDEAFALAAPETSLVGNLLRYLRYALAGFAGMFVAPFLFVTTGLGRTMAIPRV